MREPITDAAAGKDCAGELSEEEYEITLYEERPVVTRETVPVERVRWRVPADMSPIAPDRGNHRTGAAEVSDAPLRVFGAAMLVIRRQ